MVREWVRSESRTWQTLLVALGVSGLSAWAGYKLPPNLQLNLVVLVIALIAVIPILRYPEVGLLMLALTAVTVPINIGTGTKTEVPFPVLLVPALLGLWLVDRLHQRNLRVFFSSTMWPLVGLAVMVFLSWIASQVLWDIDVPIAGNRLSVQLGQLSIFLLSLALFFLVPNAIREERWLRYITYGFISLGLVAVINALLLHVFHAVPAYYFVGTTGFFGPWVVSLASGQLLFNRRLHPLLRLAIVLAVLGWMYWAWFQATNWLSGWVPFFVALIVITWLRSRRWGLVLVIVVILFVVGENRFIQDVFVAGEVRGGSVNRPIVWREALDIGQRSPLIGLGPANYVYYSRFYNVSSRLPAVSHNNYIDVFNQAGLIGLGMLLWFMAEIGRLGQRLRSRYPQDGFAQGYVASALGGLAGIAVGMILGDWLLPNVYNIGLAGLRHSLYSWLFLGGLVGLDRLAREKNT